MEFIRKLFGRSEPSDQTVPEEARGAAPLQTEEEQDATRAQMESEMADQKERRESEQSGQ